jgi:hypothetical protein
VPGEGTLVQIICGCPDAEGMGYVDWDVFWWTDGEDFARSNWPIVVKCSLTMSPQDVVQHLLWLAGKVDEASKSRPM